MLEKILPIAEVMALGEKRSFWPRNSCPESMRWFFVTLIPRNEQKKTFRMGGKFLFNSKSEFSLFRGNDIYWLSMFYVIFRSFVFFQWHEHVSHHEHIYRDIVDSTSQLRSKQSICRGLLFVLEWLCFLRHFGRAFFFRNQQQCCSILRWLTLFFSWFCVALCDFWSDFGMRGWPIRILVSRIRNNRWASGGFGRVLATNRTIPPPDCVKVCVVLLRKCYFFLP